MEEAFCAAKIRGVNREEEEETKQRKGLFLLQP